MFRYFYWKFGQKYWLSSCFAVNGMWSQLHLFQPQLFFIQKPFRSHWYLQNSITDKHSIPISRVPFPWLDHAQPLTRTSGDTVLRERQRLAVHPWSHPGHHHRHEFPRCSVGGGVRRSPALLHLLLQRPVLSQHHHTGELQLWAVRRHQAQGEDQPTALLLRGLKEANRERRSVRSWTGASLIQNCEWTLRR